MRRWIFWMIGFLLASPSGQAVSVETVDFARFGTVTLYPPATQPTQLILFASDGTGWDARAAGIAQAMTSTGALVAGIDSARFLRELGRFKKSCNFPAEDFDELSRFLQTRNGFPAPVRPVLAGYGTGATIVYAAMVQAPPQVFKGAVSLAFSPSMELAKPFCRGEGLQWKPRPGDAGPYVFLPTYTNQLPWIVLDSASNPSMSGPELQAYVAKARQGSLTLLAGVDHTFADTAKWLPAFQQAFTRIVAAKAVDLSAAPGLSDLPVAEYPAPPGAPEHTTLALLISGDGGMSAVDRGVCESLAANGIPVVALDSFRYFWTPRDPGGMARDLVRILGHYLELWHKDGVILVGYSLGADVLPFLINRLDPVWKEHLRLVFLASLSDTVDFRYHLSHWSDIPPAQCELPLAPELPSLQGMKVYCLFGEQDRESFCRSLPPGLATCRSLPGNHTFNGDPKPLADAILQVIDNINP